MVEQSLVLYSRHQTYQGEMINNLVRSKAEILENAIEDYHQTYEDEKVKNLVK